MKFLKDAALLVATALVIVIALIPDRPAPAPVSHFYAVERDGKWLDYYSVKQDGVPDIKVRWSELPKDAFEYGSWDSAAKDAKEWGGNVVHAPVMPRKRTGK